MFENFALFPPPNFHLHNNSRREHTFHKRAAPTDWGEAVLPQMLPRQM